MDTLESSIYDLDIKKAKNGDKDAFVRSIEKNKDSIYRVASGILSKEEDIEDAISESIYKAYRGINRLREISYFKTWLIRIVINESTDIYNARKREIIGNENRDGVIFDRYKDHTLYNSINSLEEELRVTTILFYFEDMKYKDIAKVLKIKEGTVKSRLNRSKEKLYNLLKEDYNGQV